MACLPHPSHGPFGWVSERASYSAYTLQCICLPVQRLRDLDIALDGKRHTAILSHDVAAQKPLHQLVSISSLTAPFRRKQVWWTCHYHNWCRHALFRCKCRLPPRAHAHGALRVSIHTFNIERPSSEWKRPRGRPRLYQTGKEFLSASSTSPLYVCIASSVG